MIDWWKEDFSSTTLSAAHRERNAYRVKELIMLISERHTARRICFLAAVEKFGMSLVWLVKRG